MAPTVDQILDFLSENHIRASYGAVGQVLGLPPRSVGKALGPRCPRASWVVSRDTGKGLLASLQAYLASMPHWTQNAATQADVKMFILDQLYVSLPRPTFTDEDAEALAAQLYGFVYQKGERGGVLAA